MCAAAKYQPSAKAGIEQMQRRAGAGRRQPAEIDREEQDQHQPDPEGRQRQAEQREDLAGAVPEAADPHRRPGCRSGCRSAATRPSPPPPAAASSAGAGNRAPAPACDSRTTGRDRPCARLAMKMPVLLPERPIETELAAHVRRCPPGWRRARPAGSPGRRSRARTGRSSATAGTATAANSRRGGGCTVSCACALPTCLALESEVLVGRRCRQSP